MLFALQQQNLCERFQSLFTGYLCPCASTWLVGHVDILQQVGIPALVDTFLQFRCHLALLLYRLRDRFLTFLYFPESLALFADGSYLHLVEATGTLFAVA